MTEQSDTAVRRDTDHARYAVERLCLEFEARWRKAGGGTARIEKLLDCVNAEHRSQLLEELVAIECELRSSVGQTPTAEEYHERFPQWKDAVDSAFGWWQSSGQVEAADRQPELPQTLGDFRLVREIGRGGMGVVYEAVQESLGRRVAIKVLSAHPLHQGEIVRRFQREMRAVAALHHSNIVDVYGSGEEAGVHYFAMQLVDGPSLNRAIVQRKAADAVRAKDASAARGRDYADVARIGLQVARALQYAHGRGVLHRDIKPSNLLTDADGAVLVADFGLAKLRDDEDDTTRNGDIIGTLRYLPPEAVHGHWDERGDVYGLGVTLYELLALKPAFESRDAPQLVSAITRGEPLSLSGVAPPVPRDLQTIVLKAAARDPADRYPTAAAMADDLERFLQGAPIAARRASLPEVAWKWSRRKPAPAALVALVLLVGLVGTPTVTLLWRHAVAARGAAEAATDKFRAATDRAETARKNAEASRHDAESARGDAENLAYARTISLAQRSIETLNRAEAAALLKSVNSLVDADHRGWEFDLLNQYLDVSLMTLEGHSGPVHFVAVRGDDAQIATVGGWEGPHTRATSVGEVILWDGKTGQKQHVLRSHQSPIGGAAYSPDGRLLATISFRLQPTGRAGSICWWDSDTGELLRTTMLAGDHSWKLGILQFKTVLPGVAFSPDGKWLVSWPSPIAVWRADTGEMVWQRNGPVATLLPGGERLLIASDAGIVVRDLASGEIVESFQNSGLPFDLSISERGRQLVGVLQGKVRLWSLPHLADFRDISFPNILWAAMTPDGQRLMVGDRVGTLRSAPLNDGATQSTYLGHSSSITHGAFTHDGRRLVTASADGTARVWSTREPDWPHTIETTITHDRIADVAFDEQADAMLFATSRGGIELLGAFGRAPLHTGRSELRKLDIANHTHWPRTDVAFSYNGDRLAAPAHPTGQPPQMVIGYCDSGRVLVWGTADGAVQNELETAAQEITSLAWSRQDRLLAVATYDGQSTVEVFEFDAEAVSNKTLTARRRISVDEDRVTAISFAPGTDQLAASTANAVYLFSPETFRPTMLAEHSESAKFLDFAPDGRRIAAAYKDQACVCVFDAGRRELLYRADAPRAVACVRFSPNGRRLAMVGYDGEVYFCEAKQGLRLITLKGADRHPGTAAFTPRVVFSHDGRRIAVNDWEGRITIWEAEPASAVRR